MAYYDLSAFTSVTGVEFEFHDAGGLENLRINGDLFVGDLISAPAAIGGTNVSVTFNDYGWYQAGVVTIVGPVGDLSIAGQEFYVDNICVAGVMADCTDTDEDGICDSDEEAGCTDADAPNFNPNATDDDGSCQDGEWNDPMGNAICPADCNYAIDFESQALGNLWSDPTTPQGSFMFNENGINVFSIALNSSLYGSLYGYDEIVLSPRPGFGTNHVMLTNNSGITLELNEFPTDTVCFDFLDMGGFEMLEINGVNFSSQNGYGGLQGAPITLGGVTIKVTGTPIVQITSTGMQQVGFQGKIELYGNVDILSIAGQELWVDNFCFSSGVEVNPGCTYDDAINYDDYATEEDGSCTFPVQSCPGDLNGDGTIVVNDLLLLLSVFATDCD
jgi:hypothetical protein